MIVLANRYYPLRIRLYFPSNIRSTLTYSVTILLAASAGSLIIDIDKFMIPQLEEIKQTAFYAVAIFAATIVDVPARAMWQILNPLVATAVNENNTKEVNSLYRRSALNLVIVSGWFFLLVNLNSEALFSLLPNVGYQKATLVVLYISLAKLITMMFGCRSHHFQQFVLPNQFGVFCCHGIGGFLILNMQWIPLMVLDGAALATLVVVGLSIAVKIMYLQLKIKAHPLSWNLLKALVAVGILYTIFKYIDWALSPIIQIILTSAMVSGLYF